ncbi:hypothetical protein BDZ89DRAFT_1065532 [Hymenopellis radicata]|nr:hypothetical protein BDZ89DRAFT_1065532 [Hymenopellis radicata]
MDVSVFNLTSVPALRAFKMDPYVAWEAFDHIHLPWSKFIRLIDFPSDDIDAYKYLQKMTNLEELTVLTLDTGASTWDAPLLSLPTLLRLTLRERQHSDPDDLQKFFSILDIPSLFDLSLAFPSSRNRIHHFPQLQPRVKQTLTKLYISCAMTRNPGNVQNLLRFLSDAACVENFHIVDAKMTVDFISALNVSSAPPLLPCLRILDISDCFCDDGLDEDPSVIYDMLHSRYAGVMTSTSTAPTVNPTSVVTSLETVRVPRWLYFEDDDRWEDICRNLKVECGITMQDDDSDDE